MATKSKNTNFFIRFIAVTLSLIFAAGSAFFAVKVAETAFYTDKIEAITNGEEFLNDFSGSKRIKRNLNKDISLLSTKMTMEDVEGINKALNAQKEEKLASLLEEFKKEKADYQARIKELSEENYEDDEYATEVSFDGDEQFNGSVDFTYGNYSFNFSAESVSLSSEEEAAKQAFSKKFDFFVKNREYLNQVDGDYTNNCDYAVTSDLNYYVKNTVNNMSISNFEKGVDIKSVLDNRYALVIKNGVPQYSAEFKNVLDDYSETDGKIAFANEGFEYYIYVDTKSDVKGGYNDDIAAYNAVKDYDLKKDAVIAVVLAILALITAVWYFVIAGTRLENGKVKRAFIDYVPTDVHLVISGGIITAICALAVFSFEFLGNTFAGSEYHKIYILLYAFLASLIWALIIEFFASFIRVCKSEKKFYNNLLAVMIFKLFIIKPCVWLFKKIKKLFEYKPENFKKRIIIALVGYGLLNLAFIGLVFIGFASDLPGVAAFPLAINILINIVAIIFAIRYAVQLDRIITAAKMRTAPKVDYNKLPESLKTLVNSLQYTNQELANAVNKAVRDERMRTELITNVSHDLKTPLTSIISYVDLLKGCDIQDESAKEYIGVLDEKSGRLKRLIDDLIEASKISSGVVTLNPVNLSLNELAAQAVYERQNEFTENNLELVFKGNNGNVTAFADGNKTFRILENLISNAKKYSATGTRVYCDVYETQNYSIFEIKNISAQKLDITPQELTERFVRGDKSRTNEGNGLGLSIADNLCKAQGGHLNITIDGDLFKAQVMLPRQNILRN